MVRESGLQFDDKIWICGYCNAECVDYPTMKEHTEKRCRVRQAIARRRASILPEVMEIAALQEGQKVLEEWGLR